MTSLILLLWAVGMSDGSPGPLPDACALVTASEAAALGAAGQPMADGPAPDEDSGAQRSSCVYAGAERMLIVLILEYPSADAARNHLSEEVVQTQLEDESAKVTVESGLGDRAYWATTATAGIYVVLRGPKVIAVMLGGGGNFTPEQHKGALRGAAESALRRL